jgi:S1-C subfamily serine protease
MENQPLLPVGPDDDGKIWVNPSAEHLPGERDSLRVIDRPEVIAVHTVGLDRMTAIEQSLQRGAGKSSQKLRIPRRPHVASPRRSNRKFDLAGVAALRLPRCAVQAGPGLSQAFCDRACQVVVPHLSSNVYGMRMMALNRHALMVLVALGAVMGSVAQAGAGQEWGRLLGSAYAGPEVAMRAVAPAAPLDVEELHTIQIFERTAPSVVYIVNSALTRQLFSRNVYEVPQGAGSGFIWNPEGYIVTNFHVVYNADALTVVLADQTEHDARVVGADPDHDLAVVQIQVAKEKLTPITVGSSHDLKVGQRVLAIGNPFGLDHTLTTGIVSALHRSIESMTKRTIENVIQIDAAINPGNSGGPLLDSGGRLIGINTMIVSPSGAFSGIGFAVPVDTVNHIVPQLIQHGKVTRAGIGVSLLPDSVARRWIRQGAIIAQVVPGGPADRAGLHGMTPGRSPQPGDVIVAVDGELVHTVDDLSRLLGRHEVGDEVRLELLREGESREVIVKLEAVQ